jgi:serine/threonine protein kinase
LSRSNIKLLLKNQKSKKKNVQENTKKNPLISKSGEYEDDMNLKNKKKRELFMNKEITESSSNQIKTPKFKKEVIQDSLLKSFKKPDDTPVPDSKYDLNKGELLNVKKIKANTNSTNDTIISTFRSTLMKKLQDQKNSKKALSQLKTQINIYDENLKLKNFMYENGKFQNSFKKMQTIGKGSFGKVFLAKHLLEYQDYAIKQIKLKLTPKGELFTNNFQKEIRAMAVLQNKNVVRFFTSWMEEDIDSKQPKSKVTSLFKGNIINEDSLKLSVRKNSLENKESEFGTSLLSDTQNLEWLQKRFAPTSEDARSQGRSSFNEGVSTQLSRFNLKNSKVKGELSQPSSIIEGMKKAESGKVICGQDEKRTPKISESENESLSETSNGSTDSNDSNSSSSSDDNRFTLDYEVSENSDTDLLITFDAPVPPVNIVSDTKLFSKKKNSNIDISSKLNQDKSYFPKVLNNRKDSKTPQMSGIEKMPSDGLLSDILENSVSDIATASQINKTRKSLTLISSSRILNKSQDKYSKEQSKSINLYIQMEYCANGSLSKFLKANKQITSGEICLIFTEILNGLIYIHKKGFIHRDLKPGNIFISKNGVIKIGDFGLITYIESDKLDKLEEEEIRNLSSSNSLSPMKKSPQIENSKKSKIKISKVNQEEDDVLENKALKVIKRDSKNASPVFLPNKKQIPISPIRSNKKRFTKSFRDTLKQSFIGKSKKNKQKMLHLSTMIGTPFYTAPECQTDGGYDYKADVYSLGIILLEMFCKFTTMHERNVVFTTFRKEGKVQKEFREKYNIASNLIELLCRKNPTERPYASEVIKSLEYNEWLKQFK